LSGAETWTLRAADWKHLESFGMWFWTRKEKISWADRVRNEVVLQRGRRERNVLHTIKRGNIQGNTKGKIIRGRRFKQLLDELKENREYWKLIEQELDGTMWRTGFGRGCGTVVRLRNLLLLLLVVIVVVVVVVVVVAAVVVVTEQH